MVFEKAAAAAATTTKRTETNEKRKIETITTLNLPVEFICFSLLFF